MNKLNVSLSFREWNGYYKTTLYKYARTVSSNCLANKQTNNKMIMNDDK